MATEGLESSVGMEQWSHLGEEERFSMGTASETMLWGAVLMARGWWMRRAGGHQNARQSHCVRHIPMNKTLQLSQSVWLRIQSQFIWVLC